MADILLMVPIEAAPEDVYRAIADPEGLRRWWTTAVEGTGGLGDTLVFSFESGMVEMRMKVDAADEPDSIHWSVQDPAPPEWEGTTVTWDVQAGDSGTRLLFGHRGWRSTDSSFPAINYNWAYYLTSLKDYLEKGKGFPHQN